MVLINHLRIDVAQRCYKWTNGIEFGQVWIDYHAGFMVQIKT